VRALNRRYSIWDEMRRMQQQLDALLDNFFDRSFFARSSFLAPNYGLLEGPATASDLAVTNYRQPLMDITETDNEFIATLELPGVDKKDIQVNATEDGVEVKVEKKDESKEEDKRRGIYRLERSYAGFYRYIPVPAGVDVNKINATYKNGVLELRMPKLEPKKPKRQITVN